MLEDLNVVVLLLLLDATFVPPEATLTNTQHLLPSKRNTFPQKLHGIKKC